MLINLKNTYDVGYKDMGSAYQIHTRTFFVDVDADQINPGEPVIVASQNPTSAEAAPTATPVIGTDVLLGISASYSTQDTQLAPYGDGLVEVFQCDANGIWRARPLVPFTSQADADSVIGNRALFNLTSGKYTVDCTGATGATSGLFIVAADFETQLVDFKVDPSCLVY